MAALLYHALWVATALGAVALASAIIAHRLRWGEVRRARAEEALEALAVYSEWLAGQRRNAAFQGDRPPDRSPLVKLRRAQEAWFPELGPALMHLMEVHTRTIDFLWQQQLLRTRDLEAWLESDHDARFMHHWGQHQAAVHAVAERLRSVAGEGLVDAEPESVFPA